MIKFLRIMLITMACSLVFILLLSVMGVIKGNGNIENDNGFGTNVVITTDGEVGVGVGDDNFCVLTDSKCGFGM